MGLCFCDMISTSCFCSCGLRSTDSLPSSALASYPYLLPLQDDTGFAPADSVRFTGFHYVDWQLDGPNIAYLVRTAYRGAGGCWVCGGT
jgi:hypothetical protein